MGYLGKEQDPSKVKEGHRGRNQRICQDRDVAGDEKVWLWGGWRKRGIEYPYTGLTRRKGGSESLVYFACLIILIQGGASARVTDITMLPPTPIKFFRLSCWLIG